MRLRDYIIRVNTPEATGAIKRFILASYSILDDFSSIAGTDFVEFMYISKKFCMGIWET